MRTHLVSGALAVLVALPLSGGTDTVPALQFTINGTAAADTVTITDGPGGTTTVSSPTFESVTFANKTTVVFDGLGGGDTVTFSNPDPATGLTSFIVTNVATVSQTAPIVYRALGVNATGAVRLIGAGNDVDRFEATTQDGDLRFTDVDDLIIGGVAATLAGARITNAGMIRIDAGGLLTLADTDGAEIVRGGASAGDVYVSATGVSSDVIVTVDRPAAIAPRGQVIVDAGRDVLLGTGGASFANDVRGGTGAQVSAERNVLIEGQTRVASDDFGLNSRGNAVVLADHGEFHLGAGGSIVAAGTAGASVGVLQGFSTTVMLRGALLSISGEVRLENLRLLIDPGASISAPLGTVRIFGDHLELGSTTDTNSHPDLSDAELDRIFAPTVVLRGDILTVSQPVTFTTGTHLVLRFWSHFEASGSGSVSAQTLTFARDIVTNFNAKTWTITSTTVGVSGATPVPYSGVTTLNVSGTLSGLSTASGGADTFLVTSSATTTIYVDGNTGPDTLDFDLTGVVAPVLTAATTPTGYEGSLTSANRAPVNFSDIENIVDAPPPQPPSVAITKSAVSPPAYPGSSLMYAITLRNVSATAQTNVAWTDVLPANITFVSLDAPPGYTCTTGSSITCSTATLAPSATADRFIVIVRVNDTVNAGHLISNTVSVTATGALQGSATTTITATAVPATIPTLSEWMLMLFAALLALVALQRNAAVFGG